ncbi:MAG: hypothetical protein ACNS60_19555 [Candidatus Cyclobacteriaceae bacterium M2_1C_046]
MWRRILAAGCATILFFPAISQVTKQFSVEDRQGIKKINFDFKVNGGYCVLQANTQDELINIYTNENLENYSHQYSKNVVNKICNVTLSLTDVTGESLSQKISNSMFGNEGKAPDKIWRVNLNTEKPYRLSLNYGVGVANIDLSGLAVENLKVHSGNADVKIDYKPNTCNSVIMDTFAVKVDLGSVVVKRLNLHKSQTVLADVGFGNMFLDFSDKPTISSYIKGSVGAGSLLIHLPNDNVPIMVKIKDSWLCRVRLPGSFNKVAENTYVNSHYSKDAENLLTFDLDVSMGNIIFKQND